MEELQANVDFFSHPIPGDFWEELGSESLVDLDAPLP